MKNDLDLLLLEENERETLPLNSISGYVFDKRKMQTKFQEVQNDLDRIRKIMVAAL